MIVLDANVLSEIMRAKPDSAVLAWLDAQSPDAQLEAICLSRDAMLATRNTQHFEGLGLALINPWDSQESPAVS